ncbi:MAG: response regulator [Balneolales bacterium]|nr:response regulator [Balneolales bacterium]
MNQLILLLVEDSNQDAFLIKESLVDQDFLKEIYHVINGEEAIKFLKKEESYKDVEMPDLILMDINMPVMNGFEALQEIKSNSEFKHIPVLMLTTSSRNDDIIKAYTGQSNSYIVKPDDIYGLDNLAKSLKNYWLNTVRLPRME